jgi:hypothetical protein
MPAAAASLGSWKPCLSTSRHWTPWAPEGTSLPALFSSTHRSCLAWLLEACTLAEAGTASSRSQKTQVCWLCSPVSAATALFGYWKPAPLHKQAPGAPAALWAPEGTRGLTLLIHGHCQLAAYHQEPTATHTSGLWVPHFPTLPAPGGLPS